MRPLKPCRWLKRSPLLDDAKCKDGQYDIKLDKDFKMIAMTRD
jgi:hypothetical protein